VTHDEGDDASHACSHPKFQSGMALFLESEYVFTVHILIVKLNGNKLRGTSVTNRQGNY